MTYKIGNRTYFTDLEGCFLFYKRITHDSCGREHINYDEVEKEVDGEYVRGTSDGLLLATNEGWICPCGKYKQDWAHEFMIENKAK